MAFILGKILGTSIFLFLNTFLISSVALLCYVGVGGIFHFSILWSILFSLLEAIILLMVVLNFSLISNKVISIINTLAIFVLGHAIPTSLNLNFIKNRPELESMLKLSTYFIPNLDKINVKNQIILTNFSNSDLIVNATLYSTFYILFLIFLSILIFNKKELN